MVRAKRPGVRLDSVLMADVENELKKDSLFEDEIILESEIEEEKEKKAYITLNRS